MFFSKWRFNIQLLISCRLTLFAGNAESGLRLIRGHTALKREDKFKVQSKLMCDLCCGRHLERVMQRIMDMVKNYIRIIILGPDYVKGMARHYPLVHRVHEVRL